MSDLPLAGLTVVSLEQAVAAPYATRQLADLGARVIKVERPDVGDFARAYDESVMGQASYFVWLNRSKESLTLDLKDERAISILHELLAEADVFVENLAPGATERLGLGSELLAERYPKLIVCEISGYGGDGPWHDRKAYDLLVQCETGLVSITGRGEVVAKVGISVADIAAGSHAYAGVLAALIRRASTGVASKVEVSLFEALTEWMGAPDYYTMYSGRQPARIGVEHATIAPYGLYETGDGGAIVLAIQNEREWLSLCTNVLGDQAIATDERFSKNAVRVANRDALRAIIDGVFSTLSADDAVAALEGAGVAYAKVNSMLEAIEHPVLSGRNRWREVETPTGPIRALIPPATMSGVDARMDPVPALGSHTASILAELGRSGAEIEALAGDGVISIANREGIDRP